MHPDIIDDGEKLTQINEDSVDFIIANHFLEHCENPIGTIMTFTKKLRKNGIIYLAIPNKEVTFDKPRELTSFQHISDDYEKGPAASKYEHFLDWARKVCNEEENKVVEVAESLMAKQYSIHYHVWNSVSWMSSLASIIQKYELPLDINEYCFDGGIEMISILRKK